MNIDKENISYLYERLVTLGTEWATAFEAAELLEETRKSVLAQLATQAGENSQSAKESYALRHPDYWKHVEQMVRAKGEANRARVKYDSARVYVDLLRTQSANERATMKVAP